MNVKERIRNIDGERIGEALVTVVFGALILIIVGIIIGGVRLILLEPELRLFIGVIAIVSVICWFVGEAAWRAISWWQDEELRR